MASCSRNPTGIRYLASATENALCQRRDKKCTREQVQGDGLCVKHVTGDSSLQKCNYVSSKTNRRCTNMIGKSEAGKDGFCLEHARLVTQVRRGAAHRGRYRDTCESVVEVVNQYSKFGADQDSGIQGVPGMPAPEARVGRPAIDYYSCSSDDDEATTSLGSTPLATNDLVMQDDHEPLKNAGIYSTEEIALITRDKFIKLQNLYLEYFKIIKQKLRNSAAHYRPKILLELEKYGPVTVDPTDHYSEHKKVLQYKALKHYHKRRGVVALLRKASIEKRKVNVAKAELSICSADCSEIALPQCLYCLKHVTDDKKQILFTHCLQPNCTHIVYYNEYCPLHRNLDLTCLEAGQKSDNQ